jgi:hypothetical protein
MLRPVHVFDLLSVIFLVAVLLAEEMMIKSAPVVSIDEVVTVFAPVDTFIV